MTDPEFDEQMSIERARMLAIAKMDPASLISESARRAIMFGRNPIQYAEQLREEGAETKQVKALLALRDVTRTVDENRPKKTR